MTQEEFKQFEEAESQRFTEEYHEAVARAEEGKEVPQAQLQTFFVRRTYSTELWDGMRLDELIETINIFREETKQHSAKYRYTEYLDITGDGEGGEATVCSGWYEPIELTQELLASKIKAKLQAVLKAAIRKNKGMQDSPWFNLDCKLVQLWRDGKIDFQTLCDISTTNCKI